MLSYFCLAVMLNLSFLLLLLLSIKATLQSSVSLTVEGGVSLVGPHCPGTVRLFCEGVDLTTFRWVYNSNIIIGNFYESDDPPSTSTSTSNPAFVSVQLTAVSQNQSNPAFGNFSSTLTVDLSQLEEQNIMNISCGDPVIVGTVPVDVHIIRDTVPDDPQLTEISIQLATILESNTQSIVIVSILWTKLRPVSDACVLLALWSMVIHLIECWMY